VHEPAHSPPWHYLCGAGSGPAPTPGGQQYHPHFDTTPDHLNIAARARGVRGNPGRPSDNFYIVLADGGGCDGGCPKCCAMQRAVARKMKEYVAARRARNGNSELLFVLAGGDNFYWTGAQAGRFQSTWRDVYGELAEVPWFAVMGNHDYGQADMGAICPQVAPRFTCGADNANSPACGGPRPYSTEPQGYNSNALDADKGGVDGELRRNWHAPDYTYYYEIPELDFELVAMDWNAEDFNGLGGRGHTREQLMHCGSVDNMRQSMTAIKDASTRVLKERAAKAERKNVAILGHYPDEFQGGVNHRRMYLESMPAERRRDTKVFNFFGHTHNQVCRRYDKGECVDFLTGGAGGCCSTHDTPAGFVAISWDASGRQVVECFAPDGRCSVWYRRFGFGAQRKRNSTADVCEHTLDDPTCPANAGPPAGR